MNLPVHGWPVQPGESVYTADDLMIRAQTHVNSLVTSLLIQGDAHRRRQGPRGLKRSCCTRTPVITSCQCVSRTMPGICRFAVVWDSGCWRISSLRLAAFTDRFSPHDGLRANICLPPTMVRDTDIILKYHQTVAARGGFVSRRKDVYAFTATLKRARPPRPAGTASLLIEPANRVSAGQSAGSAGSDLLRNSLRSSAYMQPVPLCRQHGGN